MRRVLDAELERFPELRTGYHRYTARLEEERTAHRHAEWHCADVVIAASGYTRRSFADSGFDASKVQVIPYGAPPAAARDKALGGGSPPGAPLALLWAGTFSVRKGAHHLLEAWRSGGFGRNARLRVFGTVALPERVLRPVPEGVELDGPVPRPELMARYLECDALMFPTLCDGFGMVVTEAWSSRAAGGHDAKRRRGRPPEARRERDPGSPRRPGRHSRGDRVVPVPPTAAALDARVGPLHRRELAVGRL